MAEEGRYALEVGQCYICLDEASDLPLAHICACTTSCVHTSCLERLLNSGKARERPLALRLSCAVCAAPYTLRFSYFDLGYDRPNALLHVLNTSRVGAIVGPPLLAFAAFAFFSALLFLLSTLNEGYATMACVGLLVPLVAYRYYLNLRCRQLQAHMDDDNRFYEFEVLRARRAVRCGKETTAEAAARVPGAQLAVVVYPTLPSTGTAPSPGAPPADRRWWRGARGAASAKADATSAGSAEPSGVVVVEVTGGHGAESRSRPRASDAAAPPVVDSRRPRTSSKGSDATRPASLGAASASVELEADAVEPSRPA